jgi:hypothetical protein
MKLKCHFGDYAQSMSYVAATMLLGLPEEHVFAIMSVLNSDPAFIPGHWKHEASGFACDSYAAFDFIEKEMKDVIDHLKKNLIFPNMVFQKYFQGLSIHVFPFEAALQYIEEFLRHGIVFLWHFSICLFRWLKDALLSLDKIDRILAVLRLERDELERHGLLCSTEQFLSLIKEATSMQLLGDIGHWTFDLKKMREDVYTQHIKHLLEKPTKVEDEEEEDESDDCQLCRENFPDFWCEDCVQFICEDCHESEKKEHTQDHDVTSNDDLSVEEIDEKWKRARKAASKCKVDEVTKEMEDLELDDEEE